MRASMKLKFKCDGFAMPLAVLAMILLMVTGGALLALGFQSRAYQLRTSSDIAARCAADAAVTKALYVINQQWQSGTVDDDNLPGESDVLLGASDSSFDYQISRQIDGTYVVQASGTSNQALRTEQAVLTISNPLDFAVLTVDGINMHNSSVVDWYNYTGDDFPMKVGTNSTSSGAVDLMNSVVINGDVVVGAGGNPGEVIDTHTGTVITGDTYAQAQSAALPSVAVPTYLEQMGSSGEIDDNTTIAGSGKYDAIDLGNSKILTVTGNVELYITGDVTLDNSAVIAVDDSFPDSSLTIYLAGDLDSKNSSSVNNSTEIPSRCKIYGLDTCTKMDFKNSADFHAVVYAPNADIVFHNSVNVYGAVIGKSLDFKNSSNLYYDASLRENRDELTSLVVHRWKE